MNFGLKASSITLAILACGLVSALADQTYQVNRGDTLSGIGRKFGVAYQEIMAANRLTNASIYTGQVLRIPTPGTVNNQVSVKIPSHTYPAPGSNSRYEAPTPPSATAKRSSQPYYNRGTTTRSEPKYRSAPIVARVPDPVYSDTIPTQGASPSVYVKPVPVPTSTNRNNRGQVVDCSCETNITYVAQHGDTVYSVAKKFNVAFWDLRAENNLLLCPLFPGKVLKIPARQSKIGVLF